MAYHSYGLNLKIFGLVKFYFRLKTLRLSNNSSAKIYLLSYNIQQIYLLHFYLYIYKKFVMCTLMN